MRNDELLLRLGELLGIRNLHLDIQRSCQVWLYERCLVMLTEIDEENLLINGVIGTISAETMESSASTLLSINMDFAYVDGPYVALEPQQGTLLLSKSVFTPDTDVYTFHEQVERIVQNVRHVSEVLHEKNIFIRDVEV